MTFYSDTGALNREIALRNTITACRRCDYCHSAAAACVCMACEKAWFCGSNCAQKAWASGGPASHYEQCRMATTRAPDHIGQGIDDDIEGLSDLLTRIRTLNNYPDTAVLIDQLFMWHALPDTAQLLVAAREAMKTLTFLRGVKTKKQLVDETLDAYVVIAIAALDAFANLAEMKGIIAGEFADWPFYYTGLSIYMSNVRDKKSVSWDLVARTLTSARYYRAYSSQRSALPSTDEAAVMALWALYEAAWYKWLRRDPETKQKTKLMMRALSDYALNSWSEINDAYVQLKYTNPSALRTPASRVQAFHAAYFSPSDPLAAALPREPWRLFFGVDKTTTEGIMWAYSAYLKKKQVYDGTKAEYDSARDKLKKVPAATELYQDILTMAPSLPNSVDVVLLQLMKLGFTFPESNAMVDRNLLNEMETQKRLSKQMLMDGLTRNYALTVGSEPDATYVVPFPVPASPVLEKAMNFAVGPKGHVVVFKRSANNTTEPPLAIALYNAVPTSSHEMAVMLQPGVKIRFSETRTLEDVAYSERLFNGGVNVPTLTEPILNEELRTRFTSLELIEVEVIGVDNAKMDDQRYLAASFRG